MAESMTSVATWVAVHDQGKTAMGLSNQTSFLRPIVNGTIDAVGRCRHPAAPWASEVDITDRRRPPLRLVRMTWPSATAG